MPGEAALPETWINPADGSVLRLIPSGESIMGSTAEEIAAARALDASGDLYTLSQETPRWRPNLPAYYLAVYAVTNEQFARFLDETPPPAEGMAAWLAEPARIRPPRDGRGGHRVEPGYGRHPAAGVTWFGAEAYCRWAGLRLPTEIEWEKGARGTDGRIFPWGNAWIDSRLRWFGGDRPEGTTTAPVDAYAAGCSPFGLYQMSGNVDEWCSDYYRPRAYARYASGALRPPGTGYGRVVRGGSCLCRDRLAFRCAMRRGNAAAFVNILHTGFRCARDASPSGGPGGPEAPPPARPLFKLRTPESGDNVVRAMDSARPASAGEPPGSTG